MNFSVVFFFIVFFCITISPLHAKTIPLPSTYNEFDQTPPTDDKKRETLRTLKQRAKENPQDPKIYDAMAFMSDDLGDYEKELWALENQVKYISGYDQKSKATVYQNLARMYIINKRVDEAKPWLEKSDAIDPASQFALGHWVTYYIAKDDSPAMAKKLKAFADAAPERDMYYETYMYMTIDKALTPPEAIKFFEEAVKVDSKSAKAHRTLAAALRNQNPYKVTELFDRVMSELNEALKLDPKYIPTYITIADTYMFRYKETMNMKDQDNALAWFNKAQKIAPKDFRLYYAKGLALVSFDRPDEAIGAYERALKISPDNPMVIEGIANAYNSKAYALYLKGKNLKLGLQLIEKAIVLKPNDGIILSTKAELLYKMGRYDEAYEYIKTAMAFGPDQDEMRQDKINIEKALKERKTSVRSLK